MNEFVAALPDEQSLCRSFLRAQKGMGELPDEKLDEMAQKALIIGRQAAKEYLGSDLIALATEWGIKLKMEPGGVFGQRLLRAQYDNSVKTITVYEDGIHSVIKAFGAQLVGVEPTVEKVREILLWHEFFHVLEFRKIGLVGEQFKFPKKVLWFTTQRPFYPISEISANAFAQEVMGLKHNPLLFDYLLEHPIQTDEQGGEKSDEIT